MADSDEFFDCFPSFSNFLCSESPTETTEDWEHFLESQMSWDDDQLLSELADVPLADIPSPFFDHEVLPVSREGQADVHERPSTKITRSSHVPSVAHDHTYVQKPPVVSKVLVVKDGKSSVKEMASSVRTRECSERFNSESLHTQLTMVNRGEQPLVFAHDDVGYNSMSESGSPVSSAGSSTVPAAEEVTNSPVGYLDARIKELTRDDLQLTAEEKEVLRSQGLPIPTCLPLTSTERKALQSVRRRLKAKTAAKDNRRKRKEFVRQLEEEVRRSNARNVVLQCKLDTLEQENKSLAARLQAVQALVTKCTQGATKLQQSVNVGTCLSVIVLCFALVLANFTPLGNWSARHHTLQSDPYTTSVVKTRALLSIEYPPTTDWPWLPAYWTRSGAEQCSSLLSVFLKIRFPKPYALFDGLADVVLTEEDKEFDKEPDNDQLHQHHQ